MTETIAGRPFGRRRASSRSRGVRVGRTSAATSIAGVIAVLVAMGSFAPIVQGTRWWFVSATFAIAAVAVTAGGRQLGMPNPAAALLGLTTIPLLAVAFDGDGLGLAFILPTPAAASAVMTHLADAQTQIYQESIPASATPGVLLLIGCGAAIAAVLVDTVAVGYGAPLAAMLVVAALGTVPGKALRADTSGWLLIAIAVAVLLVIAADRYRRHVPPRILGLTGAGSVAVVLAIAAGSILPVPNLTAVAAPGPLFGPGVDPLIRLGDNLRRGPNTPVLTYTSTSSLPVYLRLAVLEQFTGSTWSPNDADYRQPDNDPPSPVGLTNAPTKTVTTSITPSSDDSISERLPLPYPTTKLYGETGRWDARGLTLVRDSSNGASSYSADSLDVTPSARALTAATTGAVGADPEALSLPTVVPASIVSTAKAWTKTARTPYAQALDIQNRLRAGDFLYDTDTPVQDGYDGDGLNVIAKFLKVKAGYCVHFASTMAVMARVLGIPSRIVIGYQPGERSANSASFQVSSDDLHAWPELFFNDIGWVRFEPTPGRGATPAYAPVPTASASAAATPTPSVTTAAPSVAPSSSASAAAVASPERRHSDSIRTSVRTGATGLAIVVLLALPALARIGRRRWRLRRLGQARARADGAPIAWRELLDTADDLGLVLPAGVSPRVTQGVLLESLGESPSADRSENAAARSALDRIRNGLERRAFSADAVDVDAADVVAVVAALRASVSRTTRFVATVAPRSLLARRRLPGTVGPVATGVQVVTTGKRRSQQ